jgi:P27 family predicted phage terminase small subunit
MTGRRKKPSSLKKIEGTARSDRDNNKPKVNNKLPDCPTWLSKVAKREYKKIARRLNEMSVVSEEDQHALSLICQEFADYLWCREVLNTKGLTVTQRTDRNNTIVKKRPEVEIANAKYNNVMAKLSEFGLTPSSREKIGKKESTEEEEDTLEKYLKKN